MKTNKSIGARAIISGSLISLLTLVVVGCADPIDNAVGSQIPSATSKSQASGELAPGDVISVSYPGAPDLNVSQKIRADGRVSLPMVGDLKVAGRSLTSFQSDLQRRYRDKLQDSKVVVSVVSSAAGVYVTGAVIQPGKIPLDRPMTVVDAVMEAGGLSPTANAKKVSVVRTVNGAYKRYNLNLEDALSARAAVFYLKPYDVIRVGQRNW